MTFPNKIKHDEDEYDKVKIYDSFDPKSIRLGIESYFSSQLYDFSIYSYFCNLNMFIIKNNKIKCDYIIPFKDEHLSHIFNNKIVYQQFYSKEKLDIVKHTANALSKLKNETIIDYFVEVTFPNIFGNFVSDDLCEKGLNFLKEFFNHEIKLEGNLLFTGLLSKFIRCDMNFQFCMLDSFNSLFSIDSRNRQEKYVECLKKAVRYSFSLLNSFRIKALCLISKNEKLCKNVIQGVVKETIKAWKYDSYNICYDDGNMSTLTPNDYGKIYDFIKDIISEDNNDKFQQNKIGLLISDKQVLPIILTRIDIMLIDQIFIDAGIPPLNKDQQNFDFNISQAFSFGLYHQSFIEIAQPLKYVFKDETGNSPKKLNYLKFREECISKSLDPIAVQKKIAKDKINEINSREGLSETGKKSEISRVENDYQFALNLELQICNEHSKFQKEINAYSNRVFKNNMFALKRSLAQTLHWICNLLIKKNNIQVKNNKFETPVKDEISKEIHRFLISNAPSSISTIPSNLIDKAKNYTDFSTDNFLHFIQEEFYKITNKNEIVPLNTLKENRPLLKCLTQLQQSLFLSLEVQFTIKDDIKIDVDLNKFPKNDNQIHPYSNFINLLIDNICSNAPDQIRNFTFIEVFRIKNIKPLIISCLSEMNQKDPSKFQRFLKYYIKSQKYYELIKSQIPDNFDDVFYYLKNS